MYDKLREEEQQIQKFYNKLLSFVIPFTCISPFTMFIPNHLLQLAIMFGTSIISAPFIYKGINKIQNKQNETLRKDRVYLKQTLNGLRELDDKGKRLEHNTVMFYNYIKEAEENNNYKVESIETINQFLYLINLNYYEKIAKTNNDKARIVTREELIREISDAIIRYMQMNNKKEIDEKDIKTILNMCLFINKKTKEEIVKEFINSKLKRGNYTIYVVEEDKTVKSKKQEFNLSFDMYEKEEYKKIIEHLKTNKTLIEYGNPDSIEYDVDALQDIIMKLIEKYNNKFERKIEDYSIRALVIMIIMNSYVYALVNNKNKISYKEIIKSISNASFIPLELLLEVNKYLTSEYKEKLESIETKKNQKIIVFPNSNQTT